MSEKVQSANQLEAWSKIEASPWIQEYGDTVFDGRTVQTALDPSSTTNLSCNILDESWLPDLDDERPETMTIAERVKELYDRLKFLNELEEYQENPEPNMAWKFENREEYKRICREQYQSVKRRLDDDPNNQSLLRLAKTTHQRLVQLRTYDFLATNPEARRNEIEYEINALVASRDPRFKEAFWRVDMDEIKDQTGILLDKIPVEQFYQLAELADEKEEPDQEFANLARDLAKSALGLDDVKIEAQFYTDKDKENGYGKYRENDDGSFTVFCNRKLEDYAQMETNFIEYANTIAHEIRHVKQDLIRDNEPESELGKLYAYCDEYYVSSGLNYGRYVSQLTEVEAFSFGNGFGERLYNEWINVREAKRNKMAKLGHTTIEASEVNNG